MNTRRTIIFVPTLMFLANLLGADTTPNFSGTWRLNILESDFGLLPAPASRTDVIEHTEPNLKVSTETASAQGLQSSVAYYRIDGKDSPNEIGELTTKSNVTWQGSSLIINTIVDLENSQVKVNSVWTLSSDGLVLTQVSHLNGARGEMDQKLVFENVERIGSAHNSAPMANYSGTWSLDMDNSSFGVMPKPRNRTDVIDHQEPVLKITTSEDGPDGEQEYARILTTDGKVSPDSFAGLLAKSSASWADNNLVTKTRVTLQGYDVIIQTTYVLSPDRMTLTQNSHIKTPTVDTEQKLIFRRASR